MPEAVVRVLADYQAQPAQIRQAIVSLYYLQYWQAVAMAGDHFLEKHLFNAGQRRELEDLVLLAAEKAGDRPRQLAYLRRRYLSNGYLDLLQRLKAVAGADWPAERERLLAEMSASGDTRQLAPLLAAEGDLDALGALLDTQDDPALMRLYEDPFLQERRAFVRDWYVRVLSRYLEEHFGRQSSVFIREQLEGLLQKGQQDLVLEIIHSLTTAFADRHTLPEELAEMFPRSKRPALFAWEK